MKPVAATNRSRSLGEIALAAAPLLALALVADRIGLQTIASGVVISVGYLLTIVTATLILRARSRGWRELGLARPRSWPATVLLALATTAAAVVVIVAITIVAVNLPGVQLAQPDVSRFNPLQGNLPLFLVYLVLAWTVIAFGEEMFFRAFLTDRLAGLFQAVRGRWTLVALASAVAFGLAHYGEGVAGIFSNGAFGLLFVVVYLRTGRNLWVTIIAHGLLNTIRFAAVFVGAA